MGRKRWRMKHDHDIRAWLPCHRGGSHPRLALQPVADDGALEPSLRAKPDPRRAETGGKRSDGEPPAARPASLTVDGAKRGGGLEALGRNGGVNSG